MEQHFLSAYHNTFRRHEGTRRSVGATLQRLQQVLPHSRFTPNLADDVSYQASRVIRRSYYKRYETASPGDIIDAILGGSDLRLVDFGFRFKLGKWCNPI